MSKRLCEHCTRSCNVSPALGSPRHRDTAPVRLRTRTWMMLLNEDQAHAWGCQQARGNATTDWQVISVKWRAHQLWIVCWGPATKASKTYSQITTFSSDNIGEPKTRRLLVTLQAYFEVCSIHRTGGRPSVSVCISSKFLPASFTPRIYRKVAARARGEHNTTKRTVEEGPGPLCARTLTRFCTSKIHGEEKRINTLHSTLEHKANSDRYN